MFLLDTNILSERRKGQKANKGVIDFFDRITEHSEQSFISVVTLGELRRGVELIRHRGDIAQSELLKDWLHLILEEYSDYILDFTAEESQVWGRLRVPHYENALDKQIAATALTNDLTLVTRNLDDFAQCGVKLINPFE